MSVNVAPPPTGGAGGSLLLVFDGDCLLCAGLVRFILRHETSPALRFMPSQSPAGATLLRAHDLDPNDPTSFLLLTADRALTESTAAIAVSRLLRWPWRALSWLRLLPRAWRDAGYRWVARNRKRWVTRRAWCESLSAAQRQRVVEVLPP